MTAAMQEDFEQADDAGVVDLDPGIADRADGDRQGEALQQRKVDVDIEPLRLEAGKAIGDGLKTLADGIEMEESSVTRLTDLLPDQAKRLAEVECPEFKTRPWVTGSVLSQRRIAIVSSAGLVPRGEDPFRGRDRHYHAIPAT